MLQVGIHEKVLLTAAELKKSKKDERQYLSLVLTQVDPDADAELDVLDDFNTSDLTETTGTNSVEISMWSPSIKLAGYPDTEPDRIKQKIQWHKDVLTHILEGYMPKSSIKWDVFKGINLPEAAPEKKAAIARIMETQELIDQMIMNYNIQFLDMIKQADLTIEFRVKFVRTSKNKNYPAFPLFGFPFYEQMIIPAHHSKLAYTEYDKKNGLNLADAVQAESNTATSEDTYGDL